METQESSTSRHSLKSLATFLDEVLREIFFTEKILEVFLVSAEIIKMQLNRLQVE
jgi:hypothetical protein